MRAQGREEWIESWQDWAQRRLPGTRLGENERAVLLHAANAKRRRGELRSATLPRPGVADEKAEMRAAAKLESHGLVVATDSVKRVNPVARLRTKKRFTRRRGVALTPLGEAVVSVCREQLENGGSLRWARLLPEIKLRLAERATPSS